jgi:small subunit ribosomal protein S2
MEVLPDAVFIVDPVHEITAVTEARRMEVPLVSICDTNCDPDLIDYPIPGNDDAIRSVKLFCKLVADSILEGRVEGGLDVPGSEASAEPISLVEGEAAPDAVVEVTPAETPASTGA